MQLASERGFAIPLTIFVITIVTIMLAAILVRVEVDRRVAESSGDMNDALTIAQAGLQQYMSYYSTLDTPPPDGDSLEFVNIPPGGRASVVVRVVRRPADTTQPTIYLLRSRGVRIRPTQGADPQAVRTVAQFAQWQIGTFDLAAAFTAGSGFRRRTGPPANSGTVAFLGDDQCPTGSGPSVPSLLRDPGGSLPGGTYTPAAQTNTNAWTTAVTGVDWAAVTSGGYVPDYTSLVNLGTWASYYLAGNVTATDIAGNGLLVIGGDLTVDGTSFTWDGVVLVGGAITFAMTDTARIRGAVVSGLSRQVGASPTWSVPGGPGSHVEIAHHSCNVLQAMAALTGLAPIRNTWIDNWATY